MFAEGMQKPWSTRRSNSMVDLWARRGSPMGMNIGTQDAGANSVMASPTSGSTVGSASGSTSPRARMAHKHQQRLGNMDWYSLSDVCSIYEGDVREIDGGNTLGCEFDTVEEIMSMLASGNQQDAHLAATQMEYLVSSSQPKEHVYVGGWEWTAAGAKENRSTFGNQSGLWDNFLRIIETDDPVGQAMVCGAMSKLGFRNTYNVVNMIQHPGLLSALVFLLGEENPINVQKQAWRVLHNCCSGIDEVKVIITNHEGMNERFVSGCLSQDEEVRRRAVSVIMHASSTDAAKPYLVSSKIPETALEPVINSDTEELATRIRATLASANMCGKEERSVLSTAPAMLKEIVMVTSSALDETEYSGIKWSLAGVMIPLFNLSVSDTNKKALLEIGCVSVLLSLIQNYKASMGNSHELALRTLANLTFDPMAAEQMIDQGALAILGEVVEQSKGESLKSKQVAQDLIFMLTGGQSLEIPQNLTVDSSDNNSTASSLRPSHIMFSYSWLEKKGNVIRLADMLRQRGIDVWRDEEGSRLVKKMSGASMDIMAEAIEVAEFVVVFVSRAYRDSYNCKLEGKYAQIRERAGLARIIYVMMEEDYTPQSENSVDGWLGMMIGDSIWYKGWDPVFLSEAADGIEVPARQGKTQCFTNTDFGFVRQSSTEGVQVSSMPVHRTGMESMPVGRPSATFSASSTDVGFGRSHSGSGSGFRRSPVPQHQWDSKLRTMDGAFEMNNAFQQVPSLSMTASSGTGNPSLSRRASNWSAQNLGLQSPFSSGTNSSTVSRGPSYSMRLQGSDGSTGFGKGQGGGRHLAYYDESSNRLPGSTEGAFQDSPVVVSGTASGGSYFGQHDNLNSIKSNSFGGFGGDAKRDVIVRTISDAERMEFLIRGGSTQLIEHQSFDAGREMSDRGTFHQTIFEVARSSSEKESRGSIPKRQNSIPVNAAAKLGDEMMAWIAKHKLEGMYDVFCYHHIDDPEIACLLTETQIRDFTDKIGLRIRMMDAIEAESKKCDEGSVAPEPNLLPSVHSPSTDADFDFKSGLQLNGGKEDDTPGSSPTRGANVNNNAQTEKTPILVDFTVLAPGEDEDPDERVVLDYTQQSVEERGERGGGLQPKKIFGGLFGF